MSRRDALALLRTPSLVPRLRLPSVARPSTRAAAVALALLVLATALFTLARQTSVFAVHTVALRGADGTVARDLRPLLDEVRGASLVALDPTDLERRLRAVPSVRDAAVDRAFPHTLAVAIVPEQPLAVLRDGRRGWVVADTGRVVRAIRPAARPRLPRIRAELTRAPAAGTALTGASPDAALTVLRAAPPALTARVRYVSAADGAVSLTLRDGTKIRLGVPLDIPQKVTAARAVLRKLAAEGTQPAYVDVSVPERVVTSDQPQP